MAKYEHNLILIGLFILGLISLFLGTVGIVILILVICTSAILVYKDAKKINVESPLLLAALTLLLWIIALPVYIVMRKGLWKKGLHQSADIPPTPPPPPASQLEQSPTVRTPTAESQKPQPSTAAKIAAGVVLIIIILAIIAAISAFVYGTGGSANHVPGEAFVVTLPGANGGSAEAEIIMNGDYESWGGEHNNGYSWYYTINIKNIGDRGIQLPVKQTAEDSSGISIHIDDSIATDQYIVLHPGEEKRLLNKIYLLQCKKTPSGGGTFHLYLGNTAINFIIPKI